MTPSKWLQRHRFKRQDAHWERADATITHEGKHWTCHYRNVELLEGPHAGLRIPGAVGFGETPWIAMARCHQEQARRWKDDSTRSEKENKFLDEILRYEESNE